MRNLFSIEVLNVLQRMLRRSKRAEQNQSTSPSLAGHGATHGNVERPRESVPDDRSRCFDICVDLIYTGAEFVCN